MTIYLIDLSFSVYILKVLLEGSVSQIFYLGPSFHFMAKNGQLFVFFMQNNFLHFIKLKLGPKSKI